MEKKTSSLGRKKAARCICSQLCAEQTCDEQIQKAADGCNRCPKCEGPFAVIGTPVKLVEESAGPQKGRFTMPIHEKTETKCMLLQDTSLDCAPLTLRQLLHHYDLLKLTSAEILFLLVYLSALESGFAGQHEYERFCRSLDPVAPFSSFDCRNVLLFSRTMPTYTYDQHRMLFTIQLFSVVNQNCDANIIKTLLTALVTGDFMIITLSPHITLQETGRSVSLSVGRYVLSTFTHTKPIQQRFRKLDELTLLLRDKIFVPIRNLQMHLLDAFPYPSLVGLPPELYAKIFENLRPNQLNVLANVNRKLRNEVTQRLIGDRNS